MSTYEQVIDQYIKTFEKKLNRKDYDKALLHAIAMSLGPSIYNRDSAKVACSKQEERDYIKTTFLIDKLGLSEEDDLDTAILDVCTSMGSSNRNKYRVVFYYLLVEKFGKESFFSIDTSKIHEVTEAVADPIVEEATQEEPVKAKKEKKSKTKESKSYSYEQDLNEDIIHKYALYAAGAGLVPIPLADLASITAVQYNMIKKLAATYEHVSFDHEKTKSILGALIGGISSFELGLIVRLFAKGIPFFGPIIGGTAVSGFAYSSTKLIGEIFDDHFSSGGNLSLEDLTIKKMRKTFKMKMRKTKMSSS